MMTIDGIENLFKANYARMHTLATAMLRDREAAHDIVHDVFAAILDNPPDRDPDTAYLMRSVRNRCLNRLKTLDIRERVRMLYLAETHTSESDEDWPDEDTLTLIREAEKEMPPKCLEVFSLRFHDGLSASEICRLLNTGERVIYKHLRHALDILKNRLNGQS